MHRRAMGIWVLLVAACNGGGSSPDVAAADRGVDRGADRRVTDVRPEGASGLPCLDILTCVTACKSGDAVCRTDCRARGTPGAQQKLDATNTCVTQTATTTCKAECPDPSNITPACSACVMTSCKPVYAACSADFSGSAIDGFGAPCSTASPCKRGMCVSPLSSSMSYCSVFCDQAGQTCPGAPSGTSAWCMYGPTPTNIFICGFLCKAGTTTWPCPTGLTCSTTEMPAGSSQYHCMP